ncbi:MAG: WG repeat-containing protein [Clostridia bacterium]|nr:WG repeat-containing protein [Clostridia bacterium]
MKKDEGDDMPLNVNGKILCSLCFSRIYPGKGCENCDGRGNRYKYPTALKEDTILLGKYSVGKVLGKGGFGVTYLCYDMTAEKKVAIKEFFPDSFACRTTERGYVSPVDSEKTEFFQGYARKFYDEAALVSKFNGRPDIINVHEFFYENNTAYFVMEALEGLDFKQYIKNKGGKITEKEALYVICRVLDALEAVHGQEILHRDISPDNIYICNNGNIKLIDFGAARQVIGASSVSLSVILKQGFAPFEQYQKHGAQGPWTDIYALGATLYYSITGRLIDDAMTRTENEKLDFDGISNGVARIIEKMLAVKHTERFQSVSEVKAAIGELNPETERPSIKNYCSFCGKEIPFGEKTCKSCLQNTITYEEKQNDDEGHDVHNGERIIDRILKKKKLLVFVAVLAVLVIGVRVRNLTSDMNEGEGAQTDFEEKVLNENAVPAAPLEGVIARVRNKEGEYGYIDTAGNEVIPCEYDQADPDFAEGIVAVAKNGNYGCVDMKNNVVIPFEYKFIQTVSDGVVVVKKDQKMGAMDTAGNIMIPYEYDGFSSFSEGYAVVEKNGKDAYIDTKGNLITGFVFDDASWFSEGLARVKKNGKWGYINTSGTEVIPCKYSTAGQFNNGLANVFIDGKGGYINKNGEVVVPLQYDELPEFSGEVTLVKKGQFFGVINNKGEELSDFIYEDITFSGFSEGMAAVKRNGKWGFVNEKGVEVIPCEYLYVGDFSEGLAWVKNSMWECGYIDNKENFVIPLSNEFDVGEGFSHGFAAIKKGDLWGIIDKNANLIVKMQYLDVDKFKSCI